MIFIPQEKIQADKFYEAIIEQLPYPVFLKDRNRNYILCNKTYSKYFSFEPRDIIGKTDYDLFPEELAQKYRNDDLRILRTGETLEMEEPFRERNRKRTVYTIKAPIKNNKGEIVAVVGYFKDITTQKELETKLKESELKYRLLFENSGVQIKYLNREGRIVLINEYAAKQFNASPKDFIGKTPYDCYDEYNSEKMMEAINYIYDTGLSVEKTLELNYPKLGNRIIWANVLPVKDDKNRIRGIQVVSQDITKFKESEQALRESEERFKALFYKDKTVKLLIDPEDGRIVDANNAASEFYGYSNEKLKKLYIHDINSLRESTVKQKMDTALGKEQNVFYFHLQLASGEIRAVRVYSNPVNLMGKQVLCSTIHDITEEKKALKSLVRSETKFKSIFNHSSDGMVITNSNSKIVDINYQALKLLNYDRETLFNKEIKKVLAYNVNQHVIEQELITKNNKKIPVEINRSTLFYSNELCTLWILRDIRERKNMEKKIRAATIETENNERRQVSEELHDDLAPILSSIKYYSQLLKKIEDESKREEITNLIHELSQESINITKSISNNLNPDLLVNYGFKYALESFCSKIENEGIMRFHLNIPEYIDFIKKENEIVLFRILKELINNTIKHAYAQSVLLEMMVDNERVTIKYFDDGQGFDLDDEIEKNNNNMGIINIINRIKTLNGIYKTKTSSKHGFYIEMEFNKNQLG